MHAKLRLMRELLDDLAAVGVLDGATLGQDRMLRHAVERIRTQLVDLAVAINGHLASALLGEGAADYRSTFALVARAGVLPQQLAEELARSVGLRNLLTHEYAAIDLDLVAQSVPRAVQGYRAYVQAIARAVAPAG